MKKLANCLAFALIPIVTGCASVTIQPQGTQKITSEPSYEERKSFFFWGLSGEHEVDVLAVCTQKPVKQMQTQQTFVDGLLGAITLGIYAPRTAKVWCGEQG